MRWFQAEPRLIDMAKRRIDARCKWILVTRHPLDNISTMSLRKGRTYDELRIASDSSADFRSKLKAHQDSGNITSAALDGMIDDYEQLCETIERMQTEIPSAEWIHVKYANQGLKNHVAAGGLKEDASNISLISRPWRHRRPVYDCSNLPVRLPTLPRPPRRYGAAAE